MGANVSQLFLECQKSMLREGRCSFTRLEVQRGEEYQRKDLQKRIQCMLAKEGFHSMIEQRSPVSIQKSFDSLNGSVPILGHNTFCHLNYEFSTISE
ncbi:hypothetical protein CEXT_550101 [Caerostris extrusa]|uniref:Uncharacterized protein n=1 Tax=Caerostris extrusa TaxID=172846 RepID=A0AAV4TES6_CAEEX|nr:hypothetical protein CEXT_550101 [Caerostris extrusa]